MAALKWNLSLAYTITPTYSPEGTAIALRVEVVLEEPHVLSGDILLTVPSRIAAVDVGNFVDKTINAYDDKGRLRLVRDVGETDKTGTIKWQRWRAKRNSNGTVRAQYTALPRQVDASTKSGPPFDLRENFGGLVGSGYGFLATPPGNPSQFYSVSFKWKLDYAPEKVRVIWTFGEGPEPVTRTLRCSEIQATFFALGEVRSAGDKRFGMYWLGNPPFDVPALANALREPFSRMAALFEDGNEPYSIFIRHNVYRGTRAGTALGRSFMFSYDDSAYEKLPSQVDQMLFFCHEMVHNWVRFSDPGLDNWYPEGMAEYYSMFIPVRTGALGIEYLRVALNERLLAYYTNPLVTKPNDEIAELTWEDPNAQLIPYGRGLLFALTVNARIVAESGTSSIDDLVLCLLRRGRRGEIITRKEYLVELGNILGDSQLSHTHAKQIFKDMSIGKLLVPPSGGLSHLGLQCERHDAPIWDLGFDAHKGLEGHIVVARVEEGSSAARAGIQEGDRILNKVDFALSRRRADAEVTLTVQRLSGQELEISFIPRGSKMMEAWQYALSYNASVTGTCSSLYASGGELTLL